MRLGRTEGQVGRHPFCVTQIRKEKAPIRPESFRLCAPPALRDADPEIAGPTSRPTSRPVAGLSGDKTAGDSSQTSLVLVADLSQRDERGNVAAGEGKRRPVASAHA